MANKINKVIYGGRTLIDLTSDTVTANDVLSGVTFHLPSGETGTGACTYDSDTSLDTAVVAEVLSGRTFHARGSALSGTMVNNGSVTGTISTVNGSYTIPIGYHDGSGSVSIDATEQAKIVASNIRDGVEILGVTGTMSGSEDVQAQSKTVSPSTASQTVTPDTAQGYNYLSQVIVNAISYVETENSAGGLTATIAG